MNKKKKETLVFRKEGNVYVLDLRVKVPSGATAPIKCGPMGRNQSSCRRKRTKKQVAFDCSKPTF